MEGSTRESPSVPWPTTLTQRRLEPERMDDPSLSRADHLRALAGLERINIISRSVDMIWRQVERFCRKEGRRRLRLLDIATGAGDVPIGLWKKARQAGINLRVDACDRSPVAIEHARQRAWDAGAKVHFFQLDVLQQGVPRGYQVLSNSLFLHHLDHDQAAAFLQDMARHAQGLLLIDDLIRSPLGLTLAYAGPRVLSRSWVVRFDAIRSVRAAWTIPEVRQLCRDAGMRQTQIDRHWPCRFLLRWRKP